MGILSRLLLVVIIAADLYLLTNILAYHMEFKNITDSFRDINKSLSAYPMYYNIGFGAVAGLSAIMAEQRRIPGILIFGAAGLLMFNIYGKAFKTPFLWFF